MWSIKLMHLHTYLAEKKYMPPSNSNLSHCLHIQEYAVTLQSFLSPACFCLGCALRSKPPTKETLDAFLLLQAPVIVPWDLAAFISLKVYFR